MRIPFPLGLLASVCSAGLAFGQVEQVPLVSAKKGVERTISSSHQFHIYGESLRARGSLAVFAETVKMEFLQMLRQKDQWTLPVMMRFHGRLSDLAKPEPLAQELIFGQDSKLQWLELHVHLGANFSREQLRKAILQVVTFEWAARDPDRQITPNLVPLWLREGVPGAARFRRDGKPSALFASISKSGQVWSAEEVLGAKELPRDSVSRAVFEASAAGLVQLLLSQPSGPQRTAEFIHSLGGGNESTGVDRLAPYFPALRGKPEHVEKEWALFVSTLAKPRALEFMSAEATEAGLEEALKVTFLEYKEGAAPTKKKAGERDKPRLRLDFWRKRVPKSDEPIKVSTAAKSPEEKAVEEDPTKAVQAVVTEFERFVRRKDRNAIVGQSLRKLDELSMRAYPIYGPLLEDYKTILRKVAKGEAGGAEKKLKSLAGERALLKENLTKIEEFMSWYEVTQTSAKSGAFEEFMRRAKEIEGASTKREDQISKYLDTLERALE